MYNYTGIWIDHAHAFIVKASKLGEMSIQEVSSDVEPNHSEQNPHEHVQMKDEHAHQNRQKNQMHQFSKALIKMVEGCDELVIFGPGQAKHEFKHEVEKVKALHAKLKGVETSDKLSEAQLKDFMRDYFKLPQA